GGGGGGGGRRPWRRWAARGCRWGRLVADLRGGVRQRLSMNEGPADGPVIRTPDRRLRVFVSSTMGELSAERRAVSHAISALRLAPVMFEAGARPRPPRGLYPADLAPSGGFFGGYWQRYRGGPPGAAGSWLEGGVRLGSRA